MPGIFPDPRDELFDQLKYGNITPDDAEAEAARLALEPLRRVSTNEDFNPNREAQWTLPMIQQRVGAKRLAEFQAYIAINFRTKRGA